MFENNKILVVIPARGYSKNIPRKNLRLLGEKPLIYYSIDIAKSSKYVDDVVVSTEDSEIASIVEKYGTSVVKRPVELATDETLLDTVIYGAMLQKEKQAFDEYDIVKLEKNKITIYDKDLNEVKKEIKGFEGTMDAATKAGYEHFMLKEINEQDKVFKDTINYYFDGTINSLEKSFGFIKNFKKVLQKNIKDWR